MLTLGDYLQHLDTAEPRQQDWFAELHRRVAEGRALFARVGEDRRQQYHDVFRNWCRTEELKAWYGAPEGASLFQGTSISSLTLPGEYSSPLLLENGIEELEEIIADRYIELHDRLEPVVRATILENTDRWMREGVFFGVVLASKILSQAFGLTLDAAQAVFPVDGAMVDPHEITTYPDAIRTRYFELCRDRIDCFAGIPDLTRREMETSLVLADISKPRIARHRNRLMLAPIRCNEIAALLSRRITARIRQRSDGRIMPRSLMVTIYDTDTPYTYEQITGSFGKPMAPSLPGLTVLGTSGSVDAFRWLYAYRSSLVAQKMMKGSLCSQVEGRFIPFVFFGVLVERDAEILLDLDRLDLLRYRGNLSPELEFAALLPRIEAFLNAAMADLNDDLAWRTR